jgi:cobalt-zinc-cadmium efflux system outer membrane protein
MHMSFIRINSVPVACLLSFSSLVWAADATPIQGALPAPAHAQAHADSRDLPPEASLRAWLLQHPTVRVADAALAAQLAEAEQWRAGPHEFTWRAQAQQRRATEAAANGANESRRFVEGQISLERTVRLGDKARQDAALGDAAVEMARMRRADAIHEASRQWLRQWFDWLRDRAVVQLWQAQAVDQAELLRQAERRVKAGDAPRLEMAVQLTTQAQLQASLMAAQAQERQSRAMLEAHQPGIIALAPKDMAPPLPQEQPRESGETLQQWLYERSHELMLARLQTRLAQTQMERITLDQGSDPTVGVYLGTERGGNERVLGLSVSMPFAGPARLAATRVAQARLQQAEQEALGVERKLRAEAAMQWVAVQSTWETWRSQAQAKAQAELSLKGIVRGWQLGEFAQADVLMARKQHLDVALAEITARTEARHALWRLKLDLHEILEFDDE